MRLVTQPINLKDGVHQLFRFYAAFEMKQLRTDKGVNSIHCLLLKHLINALLIFPSLSELCLAFHSKINEILLIINTDSPLGVKHLEI